jgi:hypothetical protein
MFRRLVVAALGALLLALPAATQARAVRRVPPLRAMAPTSVVVARVAIVALGLLVVLSIRRRRAGRPPDGGFDSASAECQPSHPAREAW